MGTNSKYFTVLLAIVGVMAAVTLLAFSEDWDAGWRITPSLSVNKVHFTVRSTNIHGRWSNSRDVPLDSFRGFSLSMLASPGTAKFEYVADAGRLLCEGRFLLGTGSGTYTFAPDPGFTSALQQMGYDAPDDDQLFSMLMMDITRESAREIRDAGLRASINDLLQLRVHGITLDYIREARQSGYQNFTADDYVQLRIHGVETAFLRDLKAAGYDLRAADIVQLRIHGVDSGYVRDLKNYGLKPDASDLTQMRIHGVDSGYVRDLKNYGLKPDASDLTQMRIHGVTPEYLKGLKDAGYDNLPVDEIDQLRIHGVETNFVQQARRLGYDFTAEELAQLRIHGVDGAYLKHLQDAGMRDLNAEQIAKLRIHGVD